MTPDSTPPAPDSAQPDAANRAVQQDLAPESPGHLWAPWRWSYIEGNDPIDGCPFCVLPKRDDDRTNLIVRRSDHVYVIFNAYPYNPGHLMIVPYIHEADLEELPEDVAHDLWFWTRQTVRALKDAMGCEGVNVGINLGSAAGAGIAPHLHVHAVPRWLGDTNFISTVGATRVLPRALEELYDEVRDAFDRL